MALARSAARLFDLSVTSITTQENPMYDFYPEWGPARLAERQHHDHSWGRDDRRDDEGERPDDN